MASDPVNTLIRAVKAGPEGIPAAEERIRLIREAVQQAIPGCRDRPDVPNAIFDRNWYEDAPIQDEGFLRDVLTSYRDTKGTPWPDVLKYSTPKQAEMLKKFVDGEALSSVSDDFDFDSTRGSRQELSAMHEARTEHPQTSTVSKGGILTRLFSCFTGGPPQVDLGLYEDAAKTKPLEAYVDARFQNWGETVSNKPKYTFVPTTRNGVQEIVKFAKSKGLGVRVAGYRHSWTPIFAKAQNCVLISVLDLHTASAQINTEALAGVSTKWFGEAATELNSISNLGPCPDDPTKTLVRVGCATTNELLRRWCTANKKVTLPLNAIMVEMTLGGSNAPICHGAGIKHQTLSDLVYAMEYVDAHGQFQTIKPEDKDLLKAASGCFGLIGVVTHLVLKLDPMSYAIVEPRKVDVIDGIPPPRDMRERVPKALRKDRTEEEIDAAQRRFEEQAQYYYSEWFWFPYSDQIWINCWQNQQIAEGDDGKDVEEYPPKAKIVKQWFEGVAIEALQNLAKDTATEDFLPMLRTSLVSRLAMSSLPGEGTVKAWLPDALHFRRAIQNTRVRDLEVEIPLPHLANDESKPDFSIIQRAWWDAIISAYEHGDTCPQRMPLELRITGDSEATVAPFRYNKLGTASIEILTLQSVADIWPAYAQEVLDKWMALRDWNGQKLNIRPHWAKEWVGYKVDGEPILGYVKKCYEKEIPEFNGLLEQIGKRHGWTRREIQTRFSNELFDQLFFEDVLSI